MPRYTGKPKPPIKWRYETALCGKDIYGVYDNLEKKFVVRDLTKQEANRIVGHEMGLECDRQFIRLAKDFLKRS